MGGGKAGEGGEEGDLVREGEGKDDPPGLRIKPSEALPSFLAPDAPEKEGSLLGPNTCLRNTVRRSEFSPPFPLSQMHPGFRDGL